MHDFQMQLNDNETQMQPNEARAVARALIGGRGGVYSYIRVLPDEFLLKSVVFNLISKEISRAEHLYMSIHPPPSPINTDLVTPLLSRSKFSL